MSLPIAPNVRFSIHRWNALPPSAPAATDVPGYLEGAYDEGLEASEGAAAFRYTHLLLVDAAVDLRDDFQEFTITGARDVLFLPDDAGTPFEVVFVERPFRGGSEIRRVFLNRRLPTWPTAEI